MKKMVFFLSLLAFALTAQSQNSLLLSRLTFNDSGICRLKNGWEVERVRILKFPMGDSLIDNDSPWKTYWVDKRSGFVYKYHQKRFDSGSNLMNAWLIKSAKHRLYIDQESVYEFDIMRKVIMFSCETNCGFDVFNRQRCGFKDAEFDLSKNTVTIIQQHTIGKSRLRAIKLE